MTTVARTQSRSDSRWYSRDGAPQYEVIGSSTRRPRHVTIADARKNDWLPSVTTILNVLHKPALVGWLCEQSALAVLTAPRLAGEELDAFVKRVLQTERQQDEEARRARDLGTEIHNALETALKGFPVASHLKIYVDPVMDQLKQFGAVAGTEQIMVGDGYAGKADAIFDKGLVTIVDFKTAKTLPKSGSWPENKLQLSAYAKAFKPADKFTVQTANLYISTTEPGKIAVDVHSDEDCWATYRDGFLPALWLWQWMNGYKP